MHHTQLKSASWLNNGNKVDEQIFLGFSLVSQGKEAFCCPHIQANYQYIEMWFFRLKLWLFFFFKNKPDQSTSIFIKCSLRVFRAHFNETSTLISYILFLVQPVGLQDCEQKCTHFVHLHNSFLNFSYKTFSLIF